MSSTPLAISLVALAVCHRTPTTRASCEGPVATGPRALCACVGGFSPGRVASGRELHMTLRSGRACSVLPAAGTHSADHRGKSTCCLICCAGSESCNRNDPGCRSDDTEREARTKHSQHQRYLLDGCRTDHAVETTPLPRLSSRERPKIRTEGCETTTPSAVTDA